MEDKERWLQRADSLRRLRARVPLTTTQQAELDDVIEAIEEAANAKAPLSRGRRVSLIERIALWELWRLLHDLVD